MYKWEKCTYVQMRKMRGSITCLHYGQALYREHIRSCNLEWKTTALGNVPLPLKSQVCLLNWKNRSTTTAASQLHFPVYLHCKGRLGLLSEQSADKVASMSTLSTKSRWQWISAVCSAVSGTQLSEGTGLESPESGERPLSRTGRHRQRQKKPRGS